MMMCLDGLTVAQAARIGMGIGLFVGGVALVAVLLFETWMAWNPGEDAGQDNGTDKETAG